MEIEFTLLSTVVAPSFTDGTLTITRVPSDALHDHLGFVTRNLCGHPTTDRVLRGVCPTLPAPERGFWNGDRLGLAVRPKGGVRAAAAEGDTQVGLNDLEAVLVRWMPE